MTMQLASNVLSESMSIVQTAAVNFAELLCPLSSELQWKAFLAASAKARVSCEATMLKDPLLYYSQALDRMIETGARASDTV